MSDSCSYFNQLEELLPQLKRLYSELDVDATKQEECLRPWLEGLSTAVTEAKEQKAAAEALIRELQDHILLQCAVLGEDETAYTKSDEVKLAAREEALRRKLADLSTLREERAGVLAALSVQLVQLWDELGESARSCPDCALACDLSTGSHIEQIPLERALLKQRVVKYEAAVETLTVEKTMRLQTIAVLDHEIVQLRTRLDEQLSGTEEQVPTAAFISSLRQTLDSLREQVRTRQRDLKLLRDRIKYMQGKLGLTIGISPLTLECKEDEPLSRGVLQEYQAVIDQLNEIQKERLRESVDNALAELQSLWDEACAGPAERKTFMEEIGDPYTCEGLDKIDAAVVTLRAYLERARTLIRLINQRRSFVQRMLEFEVSASDPSRLRGSSLRLLEEEKFRKTAYPTLLSMERKVYAALAHYKEKYGEPFLFDGIDYLEILKQEIEGRSLNAEIFGIKAGGGELGEGTSVSATPRRAVKTATCNIPAATPKPRNASGFSTTISDIHRSARRQGPNKKAVSGPARSSAATHPADLDKAASPQRVRNKENITT